MLKQPTMTTTSLHKVSIAQLRGGGSANDSRPHDSHVSRAVAVMKADPTRRWTVAALARVGGLSRAAFARRFKRALGTSPLRWLTEHRLELAQTHLVDSDLALAGIATAIGYDSEFAFAKAFKRIIGVAPGVFRRRHARPAVFRAAA